MPGAAGRSSAVHGWVYGLKDGLIRDLGTTVTRAEDAGRVYRSAIGAL